MIKMINTSGDVAVIEMYALKNQSFKICEAKTDR